MPQRIRIGPRTVAEMKLGDVIWDADLPRFGARRRNSGISFVIKYRAKGHQRWLTIGRHGPLTPAEARANARLALAEVDSGRDPARERDLRRATPTVAQHAERWLIEHVAVKRKPATLAQYSRIIRNQINPQLGKLPVDQVASADAEHLHTKLARQPFAANRAIAVLSAMMTFAERRRLTPMGSNPCRGLERYAERKRKRPLTRAEIARLWTFLASSNAGENVFVVAALQLLLLTGMRKKEVLTLRWDDVDLETHVIHLSDAKTGPRDVFLSRIAVDILVKLPRKEGNPFVICGDRDGQHLVNLFKPWDRIRRHLGFPKVRIHDIRHTVASMLARSAPMVVVRDALGHQTIETTSWLFALS